MKGFLEKNENKYSYENFINFLEKFILLLEHIKILHEKHNLGHFDIKLENILVKHNDRAIINLQITDLESMCKLNKQGYEVLGEIRTGGTKGFTFKTSNRL